MNEIGPKTTTSAERCVVCEKVNGPPFEFFLSVASATKPEDNFSVCLPCAKKIVVGLARLAGVGPEQREPASGAVLADYAEYAPSEGGAEVSDD